jgi:hypothetical protein
MLHQPEEHAERFGLDFERHAAARHQQTVLVHGNVAEMEQSSLLPIRYEFHHGSVTPFSGRAGHTGGMMWTLLLASAAFPVSEAWIAGRGPFRMVVDTGAESTLVLPEVARSIGLKAAYRVRVENPVADVWAVGRGEVPVRLPSGAAVKAEVLWHDAAHLRRYDSQLRGILGMNVLRHRNFLLDLRAGVAHFDVLPGETGFEVPFTWQNGRMLVEAQWDGRPVRLVLDSAASHLVIFGVGEAAGTLRVGRAGWLRQTAAVFPRGNRQEDGLLPAGLFAWIHVDVERQRLILKEER